MSKTSRMLHPSAKRIVLKVCDADRKAAPQLAEVKETEKEDPITLTQTIDKNESAENQRQKSFPMMSMMSRTENANLNLIAILSKAIVMRILSALRMRANGIMISLFVSKSMT